MDYGTPQLLSDQAPLNNLPAMPAQQAPAAMAAMGGAPASRSALLAAALHAIGQGVSPSATGMPSFGSISPDMLAKAQTARTQYAQNAATNAAHAGNPEPITFNKPALAFNQPTPWRNLPTNGFQAFGQNLGNAAQHLGGLFGLGSGAGMGPNN